MTTFKIEGHHSVLAAVAHALLPDGVTMRDFLAQCMLLADQDGNVVNVTTDGELWITETERENNVLVSLTGSQATATTRYYGLIDLSDTVGFPHDNTNGIDISFIRFYTDKAPAARGTVSLGVITAITGVSSTIAYIGNLSFLENDGSSIDIALLFSPSQIKARVVGGELTHIKTPNSETGVTAVNSSSPMPFGYTFTPAVGDLVMRINTTTGGTLNWGIGVVYHSH